MITVIILLLEIKGAVLLENIFIILTVALTVFSLVEYIYKNRNVILDDSM